MNKDKLKPEYAKTANKIIELEGNCQNIDNAIVCSSCPFNDNSYHPPCVAWSNDELVQKSKEYLQAFADYKPAICKHCKHWHDTEGCDKVAINPEFIEDDRINLLLDENYADITLYDENDSELGSFANLVKDCVTVVMGENFTCPFHEFKEV